MNGSLIPLLASFWTDFEKTPVSILVRLTAINAGIAS